MCALLFVLQLGVLFKLTQPIYQAYVNGDTIPAGVILERFPDLIEIFKVAQDV